MPEEESERTSYVQNTTFYGNRNMRLPDEIRIEIHEPAVENPSNSEIPRNISALLNTAGDHSGRIWRSRFNNVLHTVRPYVQHAQIANSVFLRSLQNDANVIAYSIHSDLNMRNLPVRPSNVVSPTNQTANETTQTPNRSLLERVALLTRDDPPNLLERDTGNSNNQRSDGSNNFSEYSSLGTQVFASLFMIVVVFCKFSYDYFDSVKRIAILVYVFKRGNRILIEQVLKKSQRSVWVLLRELFNISFVAFFALCVLTSNDITLRLTPLSKHVEYTFVNVLFSMIFSDAILKLITVAAKICIAVLPNIVLNFKKRGRLYVFVEAASQLYRCLVPIQVWFKYFLDSYTGSEKIMGLLFSSIYFAMKLFVGLRQVKFLRNAIRRIHQQQDFGSIPTNEELQVNGNTCPVCYDTFADPIKLKCGHIFCEQCITKWFVREVTCPLCRAKVIFDRSWEDGATYYPVHAF